MHEVVDMYSYGKKYSLNPKFSGMKIGLPRKKKNSQYICIYFIPQFTPVQKLHVIQYERKFVWNSTNKI